MFYNDQIYVVEVWQETVLKTGDGTRDVGST